MSWPASFIAALGSDQLQALFCAVCLDGPRTSYTLTPRFAEMPAAGLPDADVVMGVEGPTVSSEALQLPDVSCSHGEWGWKAITENASRVIQATRRGRLMALEMSLDGGFSWEPVALGAVSRRTITREGLGTGLEIGCSGMGSLLSQRYASASDSRSLFQETLSGGTLDALYTVADATITLVSTTEWATFDAASIYYLRIYPSDGTDSFVIKATGRTATTFTGCAAAAVWDTTAVNALSGSRVGVQRGTRLSAGYTAAATSISVDSSTFASPLDDDGVYYLRLYPTFGDPFVLRATARGAGTFTSVATAGRLGTTAVNCSNHDEVQLVRVVQGHPVECALKVMQSTGTGTNGPWDLLPADWGLALPRSIVDDTFSRLSITDTAPSSGATLFEIEVPDTEGVTNPGDWMREWLAPFGGFITLRHGQIVVRVLRDPVKVIGKTVMHVTEGDTVEGPYGDLEDSEQSVTYLTVTHHAQGVRRSSSEDILAGPAADLVEIELPHLFENIAAVLAEVSQRMAIYQHRAPTALTVVLGGLQAAQLAPGDFVYLSSDWAQLPPDASGRTTCQARGCLVTTVAPELTGATVEIGVLHYPELPGI